MTDGPGALEDNGAPSVRTVRELAAAGEAQPGETRPSESTKPLRIVVLTHFYPPEVNGGATRLSELARCWVADGHDVTVATGFPCHPDGIVPAHYAGRFRRLVEWEDGVRVVRGWRYVHANEGTWRRGAYYLSSSATTMWLTATLRRSKPDIIVSSSPPLFLGPAGVLAAKLRRVPCVFEVRDLWPDQAFHLGLVRPGPMASTLRRMEEWSYRHADRIVTVTEGARSTLVGRGVPARKIALIRNGVDTSFWASSAAVPHTLATELARRLEVGPGRVVVGYLGTVGYSQGVRAMIDVVKRLRSHPEVRFLFVGAGAKWSELTEGLRDEPTVVLHAPVERQIVRDLYRLVDVALVPLRRLPLFEITVPSKLYELAAVGVPQVVSMQGEGAETVSAGGFGVVVPPEDSEAMADAILGLARTPERRMRMAEQGRAWALAHVDRKHLAREYITTLSATVDSRRG